MTTSVASIHHRSGSDSRTDKWQAEAGRSEFPRPLNLRTWERFDMGWRLVRLHQCDRWEPIAAPSAGRTGSQSGDGEPAYAGHGPDLVIERLFGSGMRLTNGDTLVARTPCLENGKIAYVDFLEETKLTGVRHNTSCASLSIRRHSGPEHYLAASSAVPRFRDTKHDRKQH